MDATIGELRALFREQEYSRFPVYKDNLDNIAGLRLREGSRRARRSATTARPITPLLRPAVVVPETKRVPELLKQFQRQQTQIAIVVDEYGGTAGLVTIEDCSKRSSARSATNTTSRSEPIVDEGNGRFVFSGKVDIDEVAQRLERPDRARRVRDGRRLPAVAPRARAGGRRADSRSMACTSKCSKSSAAG